MAFLSEYQVAEIKEHITSDEKRLSKLYKSKKIEFEEYSAFFNEVEDLQKDGWEEISRSKRKVKMQRRKEPGRLQEDKIWSMFYELGFRTLNTDENLTIQWGESDGDHRQIDVLAVGEDAIFVVECKAAVKRVDKSFNQTIDALEHTREGVTKSLHQIYGNEKKIKYIFATDNYIINNPDRDRLAQKKIYHLDENAYNYINRLIASYKGSVIYQFYGLILKNELISKTEYRIPALKGTMGGKTYYMLSMEPAMLLKLGFVLHRTKVNDSMAPTYQRLLVPSRLKGIKKFLDNGGYFPNSIIVNFDTIGTKFKVRFESAGKSSDDSESRYGTLVIPNAYGIAYIIDGQHRVYGYADCQYKDNNTIPVVAFVDMESQEQLKIFMDINENQKAVSPSLRIDLNVDINWNSNRFDCRMSALRSSIAKNLSNDKNSALYNKISLGEDKYKLGSKPFDTAMQKSRLLPKCTQKSYKEDMNVCMYDCNTGDYDRAMKESRVRITRFISECYNYMKENLDNETYETFIETNRGTYGFISLIGILNAHLIETGQLPQTASIEQQKKAIYPRLKALADNLSNLSNEDNTDLRMIRGQGADAKYLVYFEKYVNSQFPEFTTDQLTKYLEKNDESLQEEGKRLGISITKYLKDRVLEKVKELYADKWESNISDVRSKCKKRLFDEEENDDNFNADEANWEDFMDFLDVKKIIEKCWSAKSEFDPNFITFEEEFSINIGNESLKKKADKTKWLSVLKDARNAWEKPNGKNRLTKLQVTQLQIIQSSLQPE